MLFVGYYADLTCFVHSHIVNGVTIVHSHVHKQSHHDSQSGGHTTAEVNLIATLSSQLMTTEAGATTDLTTYYFLILSLGCEQQPMATTTCLSGLSLRAPPAPLA